MKTYFVYILSNSSRTLYVGVTGNLIHRLHQHQAGESGGFTAKYHLTQLVFLEEFPRIDDAIAREKQIKRWSRSKKIALIERENPTWQDLSTQIMER